MTPAFARAGKTHSRASARQAPAFARAGKTHSRASARQAPAFARAGRTHSLVFAVVLACASSAIQAHSGPPYPIVSERVAGPYRISIWTDPDATDDGSLGGQFWVVIEPVDRSVSLPGETRASVSITPLARQGPALTGWTVPVNDVTRQFVALLMDHEGRFGVRVTVEGPLGQGVVEAEAEATYDLRPPPIMLVVYVMPFVLVGFLWVKLLRARRRGRPLA
jgi:hypothetical protein